MENRNITNCKVSCIMVGKNVMSWEDHGIRISEIVRIWRDDVPKKSFPLNMVLILLMFALSGTRLLNVAVMLVILLAYVLVHVILRNPKARSGRMNQVNLELSSGKIYSFAAGSEAFAHELQETLQHLLTAGSSNLHYEILFQDGGKIIDSFETMKSAESVSTVEVRPVAKSELEPDSQHGLGEKLKLGSQPLLRSKAYSQSELRSELDSQSEPQSELDSQSELRSELDSQSELRSELNSQSELRTELYSQSELRTELYLQSELQSGLETDLQLDLQRDLQSELQLDLHSDLQLEPESVLLLESDRPVMRDLKKLHTRCTRKKKIDNDVIALINEARTAVAEDDRDSLKSVYGRFVTSGLINDCNELGLDCLLQEIKNVIY